MSSDQSDGIFLDKTIGQLIVCVNGLQLTANIVSGIHCIVETNNVSTHIAGKNQLECQLPQTTGNHRAMS